MITLWFYFKPLKLLILLDRYIDNFYFNTLEFKGDSLCGPV